MSKVILRNKFGAYVGSKEIYTNEPPLVRSEQDARIFTSLTGAKVWFASAHRYDKQRGSKITDFYKVIPIKIQLPNTDI